ncbi:MAG: ATP-dependent protease subunit HslV [candidate division WS1 bacterium]|jgi:ATP-dependent HslUV protease subunit HslV|nr:ATP-dependent protease subunit HslV [candidate division WS1 bacterium]
MTRSTTIVVVRRDGQTAMAGDGQVSIDDTIVKGTAQKVRPMYDGEVLVGYAGAAADALALFERLEEKLDEYNGNLPRAALELVKQWRTDRVLRQLEALLLVADEEQTYLISGNGDMIVPDDAVMAIGSGGSYALAAAKALLRNTEMSAREIAEKALGIAGEICVFTNQTITLHVLPPEEDDKQDEA